MYKIMNNKTNTLKIRTRINSCTFHNAIPSLVALHRPPKKARNAKNISISHKKTHRKYKESREKSKRLSFISSSCFNPSFYPKSSPTSFLLMSILCLQLLQPPLTNTLCTKFASTYP